MRRDDGNGSLLGLIATMVLALGTIGVVAWYLMTRFIMPWMLSCAPYSFAVVPVVVFLILLYFVL